MKAFGLPKCITNSCTGYKGSRRRNIQISFRCSLYVNFIHKWQDLQFKVDSERQIFWQTFQSCSKYSQSFCQKSAEIKSPKKYFFSYFVLMSGLYLYGTVYYRLQATDYAEQTISKLVCRNWWDPDCITI